MQTERVTLVQTRLIFQLAQRPEKLRFEVENESLKRKISILREQIVDLRKERDDWKTQAAVIKVIEDMRPRASFWSIFKR